jgi:tetrapyrrole methylase family protein/MazG family protein
MENKTSQALFNQLVEIIAKLRNPEGGCPWDLEQTHASLKPYLIEESYETLDAIDNCPQKLPEELGDVLLQVMLHSQIGKDEGTFNIDQVVQGLSEKLINRHPHVFGDISVSGSRQVLENWEQIKKAERSPDAGMLDGIPNGMPSMLKAQRIGEKVGRIGFDWDTPSEIEEKVQEELAEFTSAQEAKLGQEKMEEEFGDLLFTLAQLGRKLGMNCEDVLNRACSKFKRRFRHMETSSQAPLKGLSRAELENLWQTAKNAEKP